MKFLFQLFLIFISSSALCAYGEAMNPKKNYSVDEAQLLFAKQANGETWKLLQKEFLSPEEKDVLLYSAFASAYHWNQIGTLINKQRGEWLIARTYARLGMGQSALLHAQKCLYLSETPGENFQDFDHAYAFEAMARSYALLNDIPHASEYYQQAKIAGESIQNEQDRQLFMNDLNSGNWNGFSPSN